MADDDDEERINVVDGKTVVRQRRDIALSRRFRRTIDELYATRGCARTYRRVFTWPCCCWCCTFLLVVAIIIIAELLATFVFSVHPGTLAAARYAVPTMTDALAREHALKDESVNWCALPVKMLSVPPARGRLALVALNGTGGARMRMMLETATRITTTVPECFHGMQFKHRLDFTQPIFNGECTGTFYAASNLLVRFWDWDRAVAIPHYDATHVVFMLRNPLYAAVVAYDNMVSCGDASVVGDGSPPPRATRARSADCDAVGTAREDYSTKTWQDFAMAYADAFVDAVNDTKKPDASRVKSIIVDYDDLVDAKETTSRVVKFASDIFGDNFPDVRRMAACVDALTFEDDGITANNKVSSELVHYAFSHGNLLDRFCSVIYPAWNSAKWGDACVRTPSPAPPPTT